jgi:preprotein translocase subunit SecD
MTQRFQRSLILTIVVAAVAIWASLPSTTGIHFAGINKIIETRLGLDLVGGVQALLEADVPPGTVIDPVAMQTTTTIVEQRANGRAGVNETLVQQAGNNRIVVEIPGETGPEAALAVLQQTGELEFVDMSMATEQEIALLEGSQTEIKTDRFAAVVTETLPTETPAATETVTPTVATNPAADRVYHTVMTGTGLKGVNVTTDQVGEYVISFELKPEEAKIFSDFTTQNVGKILAIVLDKKIISAPRINSPITDGAGQIQGNFTIDSANALALQLRYGSLPIPLKVVETRTVGPTLGQDSLNKSLLAGMIGFGVIILFMLLYYRLPGFVADIAIIIYALIAYALFRSIPITLTLPGIAGFLLSTGSALDANILIFERLKEELRNGRTLRQAVDLGWTRAWPSIRDSNIATLITSGILFWFGSNYGATIVKGFSLTLAVGVAISLFTAIIVTRTLLQVALNIYAKWFGI